MQLTNPLTRLYHATRQLTNRKDRQPVELKINLATASLKDAEHAIFIIGAYFGMTNLPTAPVVSGAAGPVVLPPLPQTPVAQAVAATGTTDPYPTVDNGPVIAAAREQMAADPAATFGANPAALPPGAGESPMTADPAQVFAGNAATGPVGLPGTQPAGPSAQPAAAPVAGDAGNAAGVVAGQAGSPSAGTTAPVPSPSGATAGVELDADGLPWDNRIHASGEGGAKPKNKDGRWRSKRGLNDGALVARVQAELRATMAAGTPAAQPPSPPAQPPAMPPQPPAPPVQPPAAGPQPAPTTFEQLMPRITAAVMAQTLPQGALLQAVTAYALPNIPALAQRPDLVPSVWTYLQSMYPALV